MISAAALIIVLSVYNGFEGLVLSLFNRFNPELLIQPSSGKTFYLADFPAEDLRALGAVQYLEPVLEENVLVRYKEKQSIVRMKGVSQNYSAMSRLDTAVVQGDFILERGQLNYAVLGYGVAYKLQNLLTDFENPLHFYSPDRTKTLSSSFTNNFKTERIFPSGFFSLRQDYDDKYIFVPYRFASNLLELQGFASSIEIGLSPGISPESIKPLLQNKIGKGFIIKTRHEQQSLLLKMMRSERWAIFLILGFILIIAAFNVIGSLSMLIIDKTKDIFTLHALGANRIFILSVFAWEGLFISLAGGLFGIILGGLVAWLQQTYGFISLGGGGNFVVDAYPVNIKLNDFFLVMLIVFSTSIFSVIYPLIQLSSKIKEARKSSKAIQNVFQS